MKKLLTTVAFCIICLPSFGQISEVKSRSKSNNTSQYTPSGSYSSYSDNSYSLGEELFIGLFEVLFYITFEGFAEIHTHQVNNNRGENWNSYLTASGFGGFSPSVERTNTQQIGLQWGALGTSLRRQETQDITGSLTTIDWQILQFYFFNNQYFKWSVGIGISNEYQTQQTFAEWTSELQVRLFKNQIVPQVTFRSTEDGFPRTELDAYVEFRPFKEKKFEISFLSGYEYRRLYDIPFKLITAGVKLSLK